MTKPTKKESKKRISPISYVGSNVRRSVREFMNYSPDDLGNSSDPFSGKGRTI
jgi:hypothetical protein